MYVDYLSAAVSEVAAPMGRASIAPAWRRSIAYVIDTFLLTLLLSHLGRFVDERLSQIGLWGIAVGFALGGLYFVSMDSKIGNGQTIGKRLMKVRLIDANGHAISPQKAFVRYTVFIIPALLLGWRFPVTKMPSSASDLVFFLVYWIGGSNIYLLLFERLHRQGLHDLAVGSFVVFADHGEPVEAKSIPQLHWALLACLLCTSTIGAAALRNWSERQPAQAEFHRDAGLIESMDGVERAPLHERLAHASNGTLSKVLYIDIFRQTKPVSEQDFARDAVNRLAHADPVMQSYDSIAVRLFYGYDIGFASRWDHHDFEQTPKQWSATVGR